MFDKIEWATSLPKKLHQPPNLQPLKSLVSYTDRSGKLADLLGGKAKKGREYPGASAIFGLGRDFKGVVPESGSRFKRKDQVAQLFKIFQGEVQNGPRSILSLPSSFYTSLGNQGYYSGTFINVFNRYWETPEFPFALPNSDGELSLLFGEHGEFLSHRSALRAAIHFYINVYGKISQEAQLWLGGCILDFLPNGPNVPRSLRAWVKARDFIFAESASEKIAMKYKENPETPFEIFANELGISNYSGLFTSSRLEVTCQEIAELPHEIDSHGKKVIRKVLSEKDERIDQNWKVSAKCLQILVSRSIKELKGMPSDSWADVIVQLGCHPDRNISGHLYDRYWHWADKRQRDTARFAFVKRDLEVVLEYVNQAAERGQKDGHMVAPRISFYKKLLAKHLVLDSRLFLGPRVHENLRSKIEGDQFWDLHKHSDRDLCIIALKLADGVNLTTGTKSFPMRFYSDKSKQFQKIWDSFSSLRIEPIYGRDHFNHSQPICIYQKHSLGWQETVINYILPSSRFRVDWSHHNLV